MMVGPHPDLWYAAEDDVTNEVIVEMFGFFKSSFLAIFQKDSTYFLDEIQEIPIVLYLWSM